MAHDHRRLLSQFTGNDLVDFIAHSSAGGVQEDVASEYLERLLIHAGSVLVDRAQDRLHPLPVQRTPRSRVGTILGIDLGIGDSGALPHGLGELGLKNQKFVVERSSPRLHVRGQGNAELLGVFVENVPVEGERHVDVRGHRLPKRRGAAI